MKKLNNRISNTPKKVSKLKIMGLAAFLGFSSLLLQNTSCSNSKKSISQETIDSLITYDPNFITALDFSKDYHIVRKNDTLLQNLAKKRDYISKEDLTLDEEILDKTKKYFEDLTLEQIMKATGFSKDFCYRALTNFGNDTLNFEDAQKAMWDYKKKLMKKKSKKEFFSLADKFVKEYNTSTTKKSNLKDFKKTIEKESNYILNNFNFDNFLKNKHKEKQRFIKNFTDKIDGNLILSCSTTELFSMKNPGFNVIFYDKLLQEAGPEFIMKIPAMGDGYLSFGPVQLTSKVIRGNSESTSLNKYLPKKCKVPGSMKYYDKIEEHFQGNILNLLNNSQILSNVLFNNNCLTSFNNLYENLSEQQKSILTAQLLTTCNYGPSRVAKSLSNYVKKVEQGKEKPEDITNKINFKNKNTQNYYNQCLENYLVLENWDK
jgi:hypothetical protein